MILLLLWLLLFGQFTIPHLSKAAAAPAPVQVDVTYVSGCVNASGGDLSASCSLATTAGNLLVAVSKTQYTGGAATPTFTSNGCTWNLAVLTPSQAPDIAFASSIYTCLLTTSGTATVNVTWAGPNPAGNLFTDISISQWHTTSAWGSPVLDAAASSVNFNVSTCPTGTLTSTHGEDLLIAVCENFNVGETWNALTSWTNQAASSRNTTGLYSKLVLTPGAQSTAIPLSGADNNQGLIVALRASP